MTTNSRKHIVVNEVMPSAQIIAPALELWTATLDDGPGPGLLETFTGGYEAGYMARDAEIEAAGRLLSIVQFVADEMIGSGTELRFLYRDEARLALIAWAARNVHETPVKREIP